MEHPQRRLEPQDFPPLLRQIPDAPKRLYIRGELPDADYQYLCVVGSRATSLYGRRTTQQLIHGLAGYKVCIVSGLALGTDAEAHKAALDAGLPTVAVLPSSCDDRSIYPSSNRALARRILERNGALISETEGPYRPQLYDFPKRNRIGAGLCRATLIVEAGEKSGTLITARLALDYNREVLAVPHELGRENGKGTNRLIREGATLVRNSDDILQALDIKPRETASQQPLPADLTQPEAAVLSALKSALDRDELSELTALSAQDTNIALSSLLIRGLIVERLGKIERA